MFFILVAAVAERADLQTFKGIYEENFGYVIQALRRLGVEARDQSDLCHEVFLVAWKRLPTWDRTRPIRPWMFGIATRVVSDFRARAHHRREVTGADLMAFADEGSMEDSVAAKQARALVVKALQRVPEDRRAVLIMHDIDGFAGHQVAQSLELPVNTVYSRLRVARQEFTAAARGLARGEAR